MIGMQEGQWGERDQCSEGDEEAGGFFFFFLIKNHNRRECT